MRLYKSAQECSPKSVNGPRILRADCRISIPELGLQHLPTGIVETARVLAMIASLTAQLKFATLLKGAF